MDKQRKKQIKRYITWGALALVVLLLAVLPLLASENLPEDGPQASILNTIAQKRTVDTQLIGGGQLSSNATEEITIPAEVKLTRYLVGNGDIVKKGDAIAVVDKVSVLTALSEVQETLDYFSKQLASASQKSDADEVKAHAGGLVKVIYAKEGDSVRDVMLKHGSLAVLSLDGRMAVEIQRSTDLKTGSTVCVYLEDDTEVEGKVESSAGGKLVVSIEDTGYAIGERVTVKTDDGDRLGSGSLYVHNGWNATAYYGTISKVLAREGETLPAGKLLFELNVGDFSSQFRILSAERQEYEELMLELFRMYDSGVIAAPCDGIVTGVDENGTFLLAGSSQEQTWQVQLLSNVTWENEPTYSVSALNWPGFWPGFGDSDNPGNPTDPSEPADPSEPSGDEDTGGEGTDDETTQTEYYVATVKEVTESGITLEFVSGPDKNMPTSLSVTTYTGSDTAIKQGDLVKLSLDGSTIIYLGNSGSGSGEGEMGEGMGGMSGMGSGRGGGMGGSSAPAFEPYSLEKLTVASVTSQEEMVLEITLDEQDIARIRTGMEANITVEALTGQNFPATVTSVSNTGTNEGGNSKFTAKLTLNKSGDMLPGMNASAFLTLDTAENVLTVPVAALVEENGKTLVYTGYSEKDETFTDPKEVTTGVSDGEYVEILSGLEEGDTVFYAYYDTLEISNIPEAGGFRF